MIGGDNEVRGRTGKGDGFIENTALASGEENGNGFTWRVAGVPNTERAFGDPAGSVGGVGGLRPKDGRNVAIFIDKGEAVWTVGGSEAEEIAPEGFAEWGVVGIGGKGDARGGSGKGTVRLSERKLKNRAGGESDSGPSFSDGDLRGR